MKSNAFRCRVYLDRKYVKGKTFSSKSKAILWGEREKASFEGRPFSTLTLNDLIDKTIKCWIGTPKNTTNNRSSLSVAKDHIIASKRLTELCEADFVEFGKWLYINRGLNQSTISGYLSALSTCFSNANSILRESPPFDNEMILKARRTLCSMRLLKNSTPRAKPIPPKSIKSINKALKSSSVVCKHRDFLIKINDALESTGMRESSLSRLIKSDFNEKRQTLLLRDLKSPNGDNYNATIQLTYAGVRAIKSLNLSDLRYIEQMPIGWSSIRKYFRKLLNSIDLHDVQLKDLRSTFITSLLDEGVNLNGVTVYTGHKDLHTIAKYYDGKTQLIKRTKKIIDRKYLFQRLVGWLNNSFCQPFKRIISNNFTSSGASP